MSDITGVDITKFRVYLKRWASKRGRVDPLTKLSYHYRVEVF